MKTRIFLLAATMLVALIIACGSDPPTDQPDGSLDGTPSPTVVHGTPQPGGVELEITEIQVLILESDPPQYRLMLTILEPDSCHSYDHAQTSFDPLVGSNLVHVVAFGTFEDAPSGCDLVVNHVSQEVNLKDEFYSGTEYEVKAGNLTERFTGQTEPVNIHDVLGAMDPQLGTTIPVNEIRQPFISVAGEAADIGSVSIQLFVFNTVSESNSEFERLRDGTDITISWVAPPTFYWRGPVLGIQIGESNVVSNAMRLTFGDHAPGPSGSNSQPTSTPSPPPDWVTHYRVDLEYTIQEGVYVFTAEIVGGEDVNQELYCVGVTWNFEMGVAFAGGEICGPWVPGAKFQRTHQAHYRFKEPGIQSAQFQYGPLEPAHIDVNVQSTIPKDIPLTPGEALLMPFGTEVEVSGMLRFEGGNTLLCGIMSASLPPACSAPYLEIDSLPAGYSEDLDEFEGVQWSSGNVVISGVIRNQILYPE